MENMTIRELELRIFACEKVLKWLQSDDIMLKDAQYAPLVPGAIDNYTQQFNELVIARQNKLAENQAEPVKVGLGTAKMKTKILGG